MFTADDLKYLELITDKSRLSGTCYFEFYPSDCAASPTCWNDGSLYIADTGFDLFASAFQRAVPSFDYYSFNRFSADDLSSLGHELSAFIASLSAATVHSQFLREYQLQLWSGVPLQSLVPDLTQAASGIAAFCSSARERHGALWVLGM
jgi:hypothetical protein